MTKRQAIKYVRSHTDDDDLDDAELAEDFEALYGRKPDSEDRREGLWSHCCASIQVAS